MRYLLAVVMFLTVGCMGSIEDKIKMMKQHAGKGCGYIELHATPPASRADGAFWGMYGEDHEWSDCMKLFKANGQLN